MRSILNVLFWLSIASSCAAQTINPSQIRPSQNSGDVITTVTGGQPPSWQPGGGGTLGPLGTGIFKDGYQTNSENTISALNGYANFGDSNGCGFGLILTSCTAVTAPGYPALIANDIAGSQLFNYSQPGDGYGQMAMKTAMYLGNVPLGANPATVISIGTNLARLGITTTPYTQSAQQFLTAGATFASIPSVNKFMASDSTKWTPSGTWGIQQVFDRSDVALGSSGVSYKVNDTITGTCPAGGTAFTYTITGVFTGPIAATLFGGTSGYAPGTNIALTGGTGTGAAINILTVSSGVIATYSFVQTFAKGYIVGDVLHVPGGSADATLTVTSIGGPVTASSFSAFGNNACANTGTLFTYPTTTSGGGSGATLLAVIGASSNQPYVSSGASDTLTSVLVNIPANGIGYAWYSQWAASTGTGYFTVDTAPSTPLVDSITGLSTLSAQFDNTNSSNCSNLLGAHYVGTAPAGTCTATVANGTALMAAARFTGLPSGYHTFTFHKATSGIFGVVGIGFPPNDHYRGASAPAVAITGVIPEGSNSQSTYNLLYSGINNGVAQQLQGDGLNTGFIASFKSDGTPLIDINKDFLSANPATLTGCSANGTLATLTNTAIAQNNFFPGWTGTISGFTGACAGLNGVAAIPLGATITSTSFQVTSALTISASSDAGVFSPDGTNTYNNNLVNTGNPTQPLHLSSLGHRDWAGIIEAGLKAFGLPSTDVHFGAGINLNTPASAAGVLGSGGIQINGQKLHSASNFNPSMTPYCDSVVGVCPMINYQAQSSVTQNSGPTLTGNGFLNLEYPTTWAVAFGSVAPTAGTLPSTSVSELIGAIVTPSGFSLLSPTLASSSSNPATNTFSFCRSEWNGTAPDGTHCSRIYSGASATGTTASPLLRFQVSNNAPVLTGSQQIWMENNLNGGYHWGLGLTGTVITIGDPSVALTVAPPTSNGKWLLVTGSTTVGDCLQITTFDRAIDAGAACGGAGSGLNQLTGDVTAGPGTGSQVATLATSGVTPGSYTSANITVDAKGRVTAAANGSGGGSGISGATAGQALIAGSATTATSSVPLAGAGPGLTTGPNSGVTAGDLALFTGTGGQITDGAIAGSNVATLSGTQTFTGTKTFTQPIVAPSVSTGTGSTACGSATGCFAAAEASTAGTPTAANDYCRADATAHKWVCSTNNSAEFTSLMNFSSIALASQVTGVLPTANAGTGTPAAGSYVDGAAGAWTALPFKSLTTTGTTGAATLTSGVLNIPNYATGSSLTGATGQGIYFSATNTPTATSDITHTGAALNSPIGFNNATPIQIQDFIGTEGHIGTGPTSNATLSATLAAAGTTATVASTTGYPTTGTLLLGANNFAQEIVTYTGTTGTTFTGLIRSLYGTTAPTTHAIGDSVILIDDIYSKSNAVLPWLIHYWNGAVMINPSNGNLAGGGPASPGSFGGTGSHYANSFNTGSPGGAGFTASGTGVQFMDTSSVNMGIIDSTGLKLPHALSTTSLTGTFAATLTIPITNSYYRIVLTAAVTSSTIAAGVDGQHLCIDIAQNGTGGFGFAFPTNMHGAFATGTTASKDNVQCFDYNTAATAWLAESTGVINM